MEGGKSGWDEGTRKKKGTRDHEVGASVRQPEEPESHHETLVRPLTQLPGTLCIETGKQNCIWNSTAQQRPGMGGLSHTAQHSNCQPPLSLECMKHVHGDP